MKTKKKMTLKFYQNLGKLFYAIAAADKHVRDVEFDKLKELKKYHCYFTPIDSEHFSILNLIENKDINTVKYLWILSKTC